MARAAITNRAPVLACFASLALVVGGIAYFRVSATSAHAIWTVAVAVLAAELAVEVVYTWAVKRHMGVDVIALIAMVGALILGQEFAGVVIGLMFSSGLALERVASTRARHALTALVQRAPVVAQRRVGDRLEQVPVAEVQIGDIVVVRSGEVVPVDGALISHEAVIDASTLSGEALPVTLHTGMRVLSGTANAGPPIEVRAERPAADSAYAALVRLVEHAQSQRAPMVRMADRYAGFFLPATLLVAGLAWVISGDPVRALAVIVVATPCPLILAAPIALMSGVSSAARIGVILKGPAAVEVLGQARTVLFDKTGTLTIGTPEVREILTAGPLAPDEVLQLAASIDQMSLHVLGETLVRAAADADLPLTPPSYIDEEPGQGIQGLVGERRVLVGSRGFMREHGVPSPELDRLGLMLGRGSGEAHIVVAVDGHLCGIIILADVLRPDAQHIVERLRSQGVRHVAMVSGDRRSVAERIGREIGVDRVYADLTPDGKLEVVRQLRLDPDLRPVIMVGDGVNDAPALALADLGIAMGVAGATVSSETADAVITVDRIDRVSDALRIGRRALRIARQSVIAGMGLSFVAMGLAAIGLLTPVAGALVQEAIDLAVILNALRALRVPAAHLAGTRTG